MPDWHGNRFSVFLHRVFNEIVVGCVNDAAEIERVLRAGGDVIHLNAAVPRRGFGCRQHGVHNKINRDNIEDNIRFCREIGQASLRKTDDERFRHPKFAEPPRHRFRETALNNGGTDDSRGQFAAQFHHHLFGEEFHVGVGIVPPARARVF